MTGIWISTNVVWALLLAFVLLKFIGLRNRCRKMEKAKLANCSDCEKFKAEIENLAAENIRLELLARVTEQSENAVMLMDSSGNILWVNRSFERMYEYSFEEFTQLLGNNIRKTSFNPKINERLNRCITSREPVTYEALNITRSGRKLWTHTSLVPLVNSHNEVTGLVTIDSDVHSRISASESLVDYTLSFNQKLEKISEQVEVMVELTNILFGRIDKSQHKIDQTDQIIAYVKGISDQTKILGINASIEAHSAGKYGHGFRVIANEMVSVSNRTGDALKEINDLIDSVKRSSDKLGNERERSEAAIRLHRELITELRKELGEVEEVVARLKG